VLLVLHFRRVVLARYRGMMNAMLCDVAAVPVTERAFIFQRDSTSAMKVLGSNGPELIFFILIYFKSSKAEFLQQPPLDCVPSLFAGL
jgi:hypothetical protein